MENKVKIFIDKIEIEAFTGANLLQVCLDNGIHIPNLCHIKDTDTAQASCRLCFVEVKGISSPVTACTIKIESGMVVYTDTLKVRNLQRSAFKLLISTHLVDCPNCPANKGCEMQKIARFLGVGLTTDGLEKKLKDLPIDVIHPLVNYSSNRCILCGRCVHACKKQGHSILAFAKRGIDTVITMYGQEENHICESCGACAAVCPVKAILFK